MLLALLAPAAFACASPEVHNGYIFLCGAERVRIQSIVTPELPSAIECKDHRRSYAWCDHRAGYQAREALKAFLSRGRVAIYRTGTDRYGRTLARVTVNGQDAGEYLIRIGLAKRWR